MEHLAIALWTVFLFSVLGLMSFVTFTIVRVWAHRYTDRKRGMCLDCHAREAKAIDFQKSQHSLATTSLLHADCKHEFRLAQHATSEVYRTSEGYKTNYKNHFFSLCNKCGLISDGVKGE